MHINCIVQIKSCTRHSELRNLIRMLKDTMSYVPPYTHREREGGAYI